MQFAVRYWVQVLFGALGSAVGALWAALLKWKKKQSALEAGVRALLRDRIIRTCEHYLSCGDVPVYGLENIDQMYRAYHALGGNGTVTKLVEDVKRLPTRR